MNRHPSRRWTVCRILSLFAIGSQGIGLTKEYKITEPDTASYTALATSSAIYKDEVNSGVDIHAVLRAVCISMN